MGLYDVNLKKTAIGYQFDHNVYIGYQINDNRVVTFKDLYGYVSTMAAGGGGGGGGITTVTLGHDGDNHQALRLVVNGQPQQGVTVEVSKLSPVQASIPDDAVICLVAENGDVYRTTQVWKDVAAQIAALANITITKSGSGSSSTTTIAPAEGNLRIEGTATKVSNPLTLSVGSQTITYDGSAARSLSLSTIGTTAVSTLSIATRGAQSPSDDAIPTIGYIKSAGLGGNVYSTADNPSNPHTSDENTKFIFVEEN